jgi:hypothetical protein
MYFLHLSSLPLWLLRRRLRAQLVTKDQDLALLAAKIFKLNESIRAPARAIPIIHHASIAMFPAYPSLDIL